MNPRRLFVASCIALVASAFSFVIRQDVLPAWGRSFDLNATQLGRIGGMAFWGMAVAMAIGSFVCDALGMKRMLGLAFLCHLVGTRRHLGTPYLAGLGRLSAISCFASRRSWSGAPTGWSKSASTRWRRRSTRPRRRTSSTSSTPGGREG